MRRKFLDRTLLSFSAIMVASSPCAVFAKDGSVSSGNSDRPPIQAGVQMIVLDLQILRDLGLDIKNVIKAARSLYDEVTIQPVSIQTMPEVVGMGTIINIPVGFTPTGAGPQPSKKRVDMAMAQMRPIIQLMKSDGDDFEDGKKRLDISDDERADLKPDFDEWIETVNDIATKLNTLEGLTKDKPFDCGAIASTAGAIQKDAKGLDEVRRRIYKFIQKQGKKKKNA